MKKRLILVAVAVATLFSACSKSFLDTQPSGATITQEQRDDAFTAFDASILGVYTYMATFSNHDLFGQKSIDLHTDLGVGDVALRGRNYGWFETAANMSEFSYSSFGSYMWSSYYYKMIKNCNVILSYREKGVDYTDKASLNDEQLEASYVFGQALAMRGWCYFWLTQYFGEQYGINGAAKKDLNRKAVPIYTDENYPDSVRVPQPCSTAEVVYQQAENDLLLAVDYLDGYERESKTHMDQITVKAWLAYLYLQRGYFDGHNADFTEAIAMADEVIANGGFTILPYSEVLSNGFNNIVSRNWMWGQDITTETATGLGSLFGQIDIFTYSYAMAGDYKACDDALYAMIPTSDIRRMWFHDTDTNSQYDKYFKLAPMQKFYDPSRKIGGDRLWTNDICFLRIEEMYLVAAEAAYASGEQPKANDYLQALVSQRDTAMTIDDVNFYDQMVYNWRVELWGEGRSYLTRKRLELVIKRGNNHFQGAGDGKAPVNFIYYIPTPESNYNYNF